MMNVHPDKAILVESLGNINLGKCLGNIWSKKI